MSVKTIAAPHPADDDTPRFINLHCRPPKPEAPRRPIGRPAKEPRTVFVSPLTYQQRSTSEPSAGMQLDRVGAAAWGGAIARAIMEVTLGIRPLTQLSRWVSLEVYRHVAERVALNQERKLRRVPQLGVLSSRAFPTSKDEYEVCTVLYEKGMAHAFAIHLRPFHGRWQVTAIQAQ